MIEVAESEIFPYFLLDDEEASVTAVFWESNDAFLSCIDEKELMEKRIIFFYHIFTKWKIASSIGKIIMKQVMSRWISFILYLIEE